MYCLWIAKDSEDCTAASRLGTLTLANSNAETIDDSLGEVRINRLSRRKRGMASNPLFIMPDFFFCIFPMNFTMATLGLKEMGKILWEGT